MEVMQANMEMVGVVCHVMRSQSSLVWQYRFGYNNGSIIIHPLLQVKHYHEQIAEANQHRPLLKKAAIHVSLPQDSKNMYEHCMYTKQAN